MQELGSIQNVGNVLEKLLLTLLDDGWRDDAPHRSAFLVPRCSCVANWKNQTGMALNVTDSLWSVQDLVERTLDESE